VIEDHDTDEGFRVNFPGPFSRHDVVVEGWRVPFLEAHPGEGGQVTLVLDRRLSIPLSTAEAERVVPFLADAISVALGYGAHPRGDMPLPERTPYPSPRRVREIVSLRTEED
jgi:hypothetical protein